MKINKHLIQTAICAIIIFGLSIGGIILPDTEFSDRERRYLATFPSVNAADLESGRFMESFETYSYDQFPLRNTFLRIKSFVVRNIFLKGDDEGYYKKDGYLAKIEYPMNERKVEINANKIAEVYDTYIAGSDTKVYFSLIPDKNYYLGIPNGYPAMDYEYFESKACDIFSAAQYIDIKDCLSIEDFYKTDPHWRQEKILTVVDKLYSALGQTPHGTFDLNEVTSDFRGALYSQSGINAPGEKIEYLTSDALDKTSVQNYEISMTMGLYDFSKIDSRDPYEFFLSGNQPVQFIESSDSETDREIIIFRDSFGSSLAPIFAEKYRKITLVDLRYLNPSLLGDYVTFTDQDVLFIYSTTTFNNTI